MYTAVPDPDWPAGYERSVRQRAEAQWATIRQAETAARSGCGSPRAVAAALQPAHPGWPAQVRAAWESYRQATAAAGKLADAASRTAAWPGEGEADTAWWTARYADHDADTAYEQFTATWHDWQTGPEVPAGLEEREAGS
jgi:hypothetical protein